MAANGSSGGNRHRRKDRIVWLFASPAVIPCMTGIIWWAISMQQERSMQPASGRPWWILHTPCIEDGLKNFLSWARIFKKCSVMKNRSYTMSPLKRRYLVVLVHLFFSDQNGSNSAYYVRHHYSIGTVIYWATVYKMVRPMLSDHCPSLSCLWRWWIAAKRLNGSRWNLASR